MEKTLKQEILYLFAPWFSRQNLWYLLMVVIPESVGLLLLSNWLAAILWAVFSAFVCFFVFSAPQYRKITLTPTDFVLDRRTAKRCTIPWDRITAIGTVQDEASGTQFFICTASEERLKSFALRHERDFRAAMEMLWFRELDETQQRLMLYFRFKTSFENANLLLLPYRSSFVRRLTAYCDRNQIALPIYAICIVPDSLSIKHSTEITCSRSRTKGQTNY